MRIALDIPVLETDRLRLRAPQTSDLEVYTDFRTSPRAASVGGPYSADQAWSQFCGLVGHWIARGYGRWMVADKDTDQPLGVVGPYYPPDWPEPEIAWSLFASAEGRGIAFEAAEAARRFAYDVLGWTSAMSCVDPANTRSVALAERLGCVADGTYTHPTLGVLHIWRHPGPQELT